MLQVASGKLSATFHLPPTTGSPLLATPTLKVLQLPMSLVGVAFLSQKE